MEYKNNNIKEFVDRINSDQFLSVTVYNKDYGMNCKLNRKSALNLMNALDILVNVRCGYIRPTEFDDLEFVTNDGNRYLLVYDRDYRKDMSNVSRETFDQFINLLKEGI